MEMAMGRILVSGILLIQLLFLPILTLAIVPAIIVFGDSTVDSGNNNYIWTIVKSNFKPYGRDFIGGKATGRFCNGRLATDFISEAFGLKPIVPAYLDPNYGIEDFATGVCFASAGTGLDNVTSDLLSVIPLWKEFEYFRDYTKKLLRYQGYSNSLRTLREALYVASIGTNDFIENYFPNIGRSLKFTVKEYEDFLINNAENFITNIYHLGARKIAFVGLPPIGCLPTERSTNRFISHGGCVEDHNKVAQSYNKKLQGRIQKLNNSLRGIRLVYIDLYSYVIGMILNPSSYGLENVEIGCCGTGQFEVSYLCNSGSPFTCPDAAKYLFWDAVHPTEKANQIVVNLLMKSSLAPFSKGVIV